MKCQEVRDRLDDSIDGILGLADEADLRAHIETCVSCREEERAIRSLVAEAARLPRELAPARDLWPGIARRIDRRSPFDFGWNLRWALGSAAVVAVAVVGLLVAGRGDEAVTATAVFSPSSKPHLLRPVSASGSVSLEDAEGEFDRASAELLLFLESHRSQLPPNTVDELREHLAAIDGALDEIRAVLRANPGNAEATRMLASTQRRKVDVLRRVVGLSRI